MTSRARPEILSIVIPAYNEEDAIAATVARCLEARPRLKKAAGLQAVEILVVSDGSTDRTAEIARGFPEIKLIAYEKNRGYGAAIKEGFVQSNGTLVAFLDADGTCDPNAFAEMCRVAVQDGADVVLGSRMGPGSKMPPVRRVGNMLFATLLGLLSGRRVNDTASGMRVIRRAALSQLYPLPDGMDFTPAMSARALFNHCKIVEIPMPYEERIGQSKLRVLHDGVRFLKAIFAAMLCYRPERFFLMGFGLCLFAGLLLAAFPAEHYWVHHRLEEWMIYRFTACFLLGTCGYFLLSATALAHQMASFGPHRRDGESYLPSVVLSLFEGKTLVALLGILAGATGLLWGPGIGEFLVTGHVTLHWSRLLGGGFCLLLAAHTALTRILLQVVALWQGEHRESAGPADGTLSFLPPALDPEDQHEAKCA